MLSFRSAWSAAAMLISLLGFVACGGHASTAVPADGAMASSMLRTPDTGGYLVIHNFKGAPDGGVPYAGLINSGGTLYGTTYGGGKYSYGTVYAITTAGAEHVVHGFGLSPDGAIPQAALLDVGGTLYGTTYLGPGPTGSKGMLFSVDTATGLEKVLFDFGATSTDGTGPLGDLINVNGTLYGTTAFGGTHNGGTLYRATTSGGHHVLHNFASAATDGQTPLYGPLVSLNGTLYGTTNAGGIQNQGVIFSLAGTTEHVLYQFGAKAHDGYGPYGGLVAYNGVLYGMTQSGGQYGLGAVFAYTPGGTETTLHSFGGTIVHDGASPESGLTVANGKLYGMTYYGGDFGNGTVFSMTTAGVVNILHSFGATSTDGITPMSTLLNVNGILYGTTPYGGTNGQGTVFHIKAI